MYLGSMSRVKRIEDVLPGKAVLLATGLLLYMVLTLSRASGPLVSQKLPCKLNKFELR